MFPGVTDGDEQPQPYGESGHEILVKQANMLDIIARAVSGPGGNYSLNLLPGVYDVCVNSEYSICVQWVIVTAGNYVILDLGIAMQ